MTDIIILELDGGGTVHGTVYPYELPGQGLSTVAHDPGFQPVSSLVIGTTLGEDAEGNDKTQLVMFVNDDFAIANQNVKYSQAFVGARHSLTLASLLAAVAGDATEMAWFTDVFFGGPAAGAVFDTGGSFTVAEFTQLKTIGNAGGWAINSSSTVDGNDSAAHQSRHTFIVDETANSNGPFDIQLELKDINEIAIDKTVFNDSGADWARFSVRLGNGLGAGFVPSTPGDGVSFSLQGLTRDDSGAFPGLRFSEDYIEFFGSLEDGDVANPIFFIDTSASGTHTVSIRQQAITSKPVRPTSVPTLPLWALAGLLGLIIALVGLQYRKTEKLQR